MTRTHTHSVNSESKPKMPMRGLVLAFPGAAPDAWSKLETQGRTACDGLHFGSWEKGYQGCSRQNVFDCIYIFIKSRINRET